MDRRQFVAQTTMFTLGTVLTQSFLSQKSLASTLTTDHPLSILQGMTTASETQLTVDVPIEMPVQFRLIHSETGTVFTESELLYKTMTHSPWAVYYLRYENLFPLGKYIFQVLDAQQNIFDQRELRLLDLDKITSRVSFISCARDALSNKDAWESVAKQNPDLLIFMGDNVYGDYRVEPGPASLWNRYIEGRLRMRMYHLPALIPCIATWDDHDFGKNNADGNYKHKNSSLEHFNVFFPRKTVSEVYEHGPGVASSLKAFGVQFLMLDDRYFRSEKKDKKGSTLGNSQTAWALEQIKNFYGPTWIIHGSQFFGAVYGGESYEGQFYSDFMGFMEAIKATGRKVLFASGDVHFSEVMAIEESILGYPTYEFTSSSIHSMNKFWLARNPRRLSGTPKKNHLCIDQSLNNNALQLGVRCIDSDADVIFSNDLLLTNF